MFESAERGLLIVKHTVDRYTPGEKLRGYAARSLWVGSAHEGVQAEVGIIGDSDRILLGFIRYNGQDGAENLFPGNCHVVLHMDKHRGFYEVASLKPFRVPLAADQHFRAFFNAFADV